MSCSSDMAYPPRRAPTSDRQTMSAWRSAPSRMFSTRCSAGWLTPAVNSPTLPELILRRDSKAPQVARFHSAEPGSAILPSTVSHPYQLTISEGAQAIRARRLSCLELVDSCLGRIEKIEHEIKAWALLD